MSIDMGVVQRRLDVVVLHIMVIYEQQIKLVADLWLV
jgi:hypothetical protein